MVPQSHRIPNNLQSSCVIDPVLALSEYGVPLIQQLGKYMELWVVRELWNILDNPTFYLNQPDLITPKGLATRNSPQQERRALESTLASLKAWATFRSETDLSGLGLFWLGDSLKESLLPDNQSLDLFHRWEAIAATLDHELDLQPTRSSILSLAFRDTIALTISLGSAFILSYHPTTDFEEPHPPEICRTMETWGLICQTLSPEDAMVIRERGILQQLLVSTGLAKYLWAGNNLAVVHLISPVGLYQLRGPLPISQESPRSIEQREKASGLTHRIWQKTKGSWYVL